MTIKSASQAQARAARRIEALRGVLETTDRIITKRPIRVRMVEGLHAPEFTDGKDVYISQDEVAKVLAKNPTPDDMMNLVLQTKGLNYHGLSHILYTPREKSEIVRKITEADRADHTTYHKWAFNALEDQRIETLFSAAYGPSKAYFTAAATRWLLTTPAATSRAHVLVHGRKYLDPQVRRGMRDLFAQVFGQADADEFADIIDEYVTVVYPTNTLRGLTLVKRYAALCKRLFPGSQLPPTPTDCHDNPQPVSEGQPSKEKQEDAIDKIPSLDEPESEPIGGDADGDDEADDDGDEGEGESPSKGSGAKDTPQGADDDDDDGDFDADGPDDSVGKSEPGQDGGDGIGVGEGHVDGGEHEPVDLDAVIADIEAALDKVLNDDTLLDDIESTVDAVRAAIRGSSVLLDSHEAPFATHDVPGEIKRAAREMRRHLAVLKTDMEPEVQRRQNVGRLNVRRWATAAPGEVDIFNLWHPGTESEGGIEAVICIDLSGSMRGNQILLASHAVWTIKSSLEAVAIPTTVLGFSDDWYLLYRSTERADHNRFRLYDDIGGTHLMPALQRAGDVLLRSSKPNRLLFVVSDSQWFDATQTDSHIAGLRKAGVFTTFIGINANVNAADRGFEFGKSVTTAAEIPEIVRTVVSGVLRRYSRVG